MMKEALLYEKLENKSVGCLLCAHRCKISKDKFGLCGVRQNIDGVLYTHVWGKLVASHIDPIEKKPLYHFLPGSFSFSIATIGCNFRCAFCQNWEISQQRLSLSKLIQSDLKGTLPEKEVLPEEIVKLALRYNCRSISYTYTEPTVFFEYAYQTAKLAKEKGLYNNFVTNGFMSRECLEMLKGCLDAANVDLKFFKDESYRQICGGRLEPVLDSIKLMRQLGIWVEVTTLVVPQENDSSEELSKIAEFLAGVDKDIPWHISKFHPDYKFTDRAPTSEMTLKIAQKLGQEAGLRYIYVGNVWGWGNDTHCHNCQRLLIGREGFSVLENQSKSGRCVYCQTVIPGIFE